MVSYPGTPPNLDYPLAWTDEVGITVPLRASPKYSSPPTVQQAALDPSLRWAAPAVLLYLGSGVSPFLTTAKLSFHSNIFLTCLGKERRSRKVGFSSALTVRKTVSLSNLLGRGPP